MTMRLLRPEWYLEKKAFHMICAVYDTPASSAEGSVYVVMSCKQQQSSNVSQAPVR